jgi:hypothetical protein
MDEVFFSTFDELRAGPEKNPLQPGASKVQASLRGGTIMPNNVGPSKIAIFTRLSQDNNESGRIRGGRSGGGECS